MKRTTIFLLVIGVLSLACAGPATSPPAPLGGDPVTSDPPEEDFRYPAALLGTPVMSGDARMNGITYVAQGKGPHPTLILLHGYPGEERNLDLAQAIRRAGWNVLFFHYRGAWGSEGEFSFSNAIEDVNAAVALAGTQAFNEPRRGDAGRVAVLGHSMGGFLALTAASGNRAIDCVGAISPANLGLRAGLDADAAAAAARRLDGWSGPIRGTSGEALVAEIAANAERFDLRRHAQALSDRPVLLVAGARDQVTPPDQNHLPLRDALQAADALILRTLVLDADHAYSSRRIELARTVVQWLQERCAR